MTATQRRRITISHDQLITAEPLSASSSLPLLVRPRLEGLDLAAWAKDNREFIEGQLLKHGAILFRDFCVAEVDGFQQVLNTITSHSLLEYTNRSTPRSTVSGNIYTSTEYPASEHIPHHNELSYCTTWPRFLWFCCVQNADSGGETPISDSRRVFERLDPAIRQRFAEKKVMYVRNYGSGFDLSWMSAFNAASKADVELYCRSAGITFEWLPGNRLRTRQISQAVAQHPITGDVVWFNQANLFHISTLSAGVRQQLLASFAEEDLPRNACYGDGSPIEDSVIEEIQQVYREQEIVFPWQRGDVLMLDNMLTTHARRPFSGKRKVVVAMAGPYSEERK